MHGLPQRINDLNFSVSSYANKEPLSVSDQGTVGLAQLWARCGVLLALGGRTAFKSDIQHIRASYCLPIRVLYWTGTQ